MSDQQAIIIDRLRLNLKAAGIAASEGDIQAIVEKGFLQIPLLFDALVQREAMDLVPDYLAAWGAPAELTAVERHMTTLLKSALAAGGKSAEPKTTPATSTSAISQPAPEILVVADELRRGAISPVELTEQALERIVQRDVEINAFQLVLSERARAAARQAEAEIRQGHYRVPLHGIPVAIKDLLNLAGTPTTAGSKIRAGEIVDENAAAVEKLEAAGTIIVGKTRMSEFAYAPSSLNPHYGPTRNPRALDHDTGGSSSGSAAAVAAGLVFAALGSDTGGSIRIPAAHCGLVGLKPTFGRISLYGAVNLAWSLDHLGPLTRTVADAALIFDALAGVDPRDARTRPVSPVPMDELVSREPDVRGLRIGVLREDGSGAALASADVLAAWRAGLQSLQQAGAHLIEIDLPELRTMWALGAGLLAQEAASYHLPNLRTRLNDFGEFMRLRILAAFAYEPGAFVRGQQIRGVLRQRANTLFDQVDLVSTPTMPAGAPLLGTASPTFFTMPFNLLGWPSLTVPCGKTSDGLPLGLQLAGRPWDEATVLRAGLALEAALAKSS